jgi:prepilin-type N-terminal cleavage/methylation domain-containing protein
MATVRHTPRGGFTLLELILALALGALLLAALYAAISTHLGLTHIGRKVLSENAVAQLVVDKLTKDIASELRPTLPKQSSSSGGGGGASAGGAASAGAATSGATGGSTGGTSGGTGGSGMSSGGGSGGTSATVVSNLGVQGDESTLTLYVARYVKPAVNPVDTTDDTVEQPLRFDQRQVQYFYSDGGGQRGLYRQDIPLPLTYQGVANIMVPPATAGPGDDGVVLLAPEVRSITFEYFDGANWQPTWDGTQLGQDGVTPLGPPLAIRVTMSIAPPGKGAEADNSDSWKTLQHVIPIVTANGVGTNSSNANNPNTTNSTTGGMSP